MHGGCRQQTPLVVKCMRFVDNTSRGAVGSCLMTGSLYIVPAGMSLAGVSTALQQRRPLLSLQPPRRTQSCSRCLPPPRRRASCGSWRCCSSTTTPTWRPRPRRLPSAPMQVTVHYCEQMVVRWQLCVHQVSRAVMHLHLITSQHHACGCRSAAVAEMSWHFCRGCRRCNGHSSELQRGAGRIQAHACAAGVPS